MRGLKILKGTCTYFVTDFICVHTYPQEVSIAITDDTDDVVVVCSVVFVLCFCDEAR